MTGDCLKTLMIFNKRQVVAVQRLLEIRPYKAGDEEKILSLFMKVFGKEMSAAYWKWRFQNNPSGGIFIDLMWDDNILAGHYAVSPMKTLVNGEKEYNTALSLTTMTNPDYQGKGVFVALANKLYSRLRENGFTMVYGFPNINIHRTRVKSLDWFDIYEIPTFSLDLEGYDRKHVDLKNVVILNKFDVRFDYLWEKVKADFGVITVRDRKYLDWRYSLNPQNKYYIFACVEGEDLSGYAVCKKYKNEIDIVDLLTVNNPDVGMDLMKGIIGWAKNQDSKALNMWLNVTNSLHLALEKCGFRNCEPITFFGACALDAGFPRGLVGDFRNWYLTMGDSDVY